MSTHAHAQQRDEQYRPPSSPSLRLVDDEPIDLAPKFAQAADLFVQSMLDVARQILVSEDLSAAARCWDALRGDFNESLSGYSAAIRIGAPRAARVPAAGLDRRILEMAERIGGQDLEARVAFAMSTYTRTLRIGATLRHAPATRAQDDQECARAYRRAVDLHWLGYIGMCAVDRDVAKTHAGLEFVTKAFETGARDAYRAIRMAVTIRDGNPIADDGSEMSAAEIAEEQQLADLDLSA
ncbi:MAG: hypothetical protein K1X94_03305 [Sandaracinaceae bacterium]|nr:hypothetical protein [Sandaracinaceae bacterium]